MLPRRMLLCRRLDLFLKSGIHRAGLGARDRLDFASTGTRLVSLPDELVQRLLEHREPIDVGVAELDLHLGSARDHRRRIRLEQHATDRPYRARAGNFGKPVVNARREAHHRNPGIAAPYHAGRAGMVLLTDQRHPVIPDADNRLDDADAQSARVERVALLDMRLEIAEIA